MTIFYISRYTEVEQLLCGIILLSDIADYNNVYTCSDQDPRKGCQASIKSLISLGSDDDDALDEYSVIDTGENYSLTARFYNVP